MLRPRGANEKYGSDRCHLIADGQETGGSVVGGHCGHCCFGIGGSHLVGFTKESGSPFGNAHDLACGDPREIEIVLLLFLAPTWDIQ